MLSKSPTFYFQGKFSLLDFKNKLEARVEIAEKEKKGWFGGSKQPASAENNAFQVNIFKKVEKTEIPVMTGAGNWTRYIQFEGKLYWVWSDELELFQFEDLETSLPSSSLRRKEIKLIEEKKYDQADKLVEAIEYKEDKDAALRKKPKKK